MRDNDFSYAKDLYEKKEYQACVNYINENVWKCTPQLKDYILRADALFAMGRFEEGVQFSQGMINYKHPKQDDIEALKRLREYHIKTNWKLGEGKFDTRIKCIEGDDCDEEIVPEVCADKNVKSLLQCARYYYKRDDIVKAAFYHSIYTALVPDDAEIDNGEMWTVSLQEGNMSFVYEQIWAENNDMMAFVIDDMNDYDAYFQMAKIAQTIGKKTFFLVPEVGIEIDDDTLIPSKDNFLAMSYEYAENIEGVDVIAPIALERNGECVESNRLLILDDISKKAKRNELLLIAERRIFRTMKSSYVNRSVIHYVASNQNYPNARHITNFGYINGYINFWSNYYDVDIEVLLNEKPKYKYSIVIPVRNNAATLEYTLRSCLNQEMDDFEILISDNSDDNNREVEALIKTKFRSDKIRYIRTPRVLSLTKSFEFAYLNARGEFVISMGADDALMPNALHHLDNIRKEIGYDKEFLMWERNTYYWHGMKKTGQEDLLIIPRPYKEGQYDICEFDAKAMIKYALMDPQQMYIAPMFYINSGFRKDYLKRILKETGAILDGISQDVYMAVVNLAINDTYFYAKYPITVAGLSNRSAGLKSAVGQSTSDDFEASQREYSLGGNVYHMQRDSEDLLIISEGDVANLAAMLMRIIDMGCLPSEWINEYDWYVLGKRIIEQAQKNDINYKKIREELIHTVCLFDKEAAKKLDEDIESGVIRPNEQLEQEDKLYKEGITAEGTEYRDASKDGAYDVYEVAILCDKILKRNSNN